MESSAKLTLVSCVRSDPVSHLTEEVVKYLDSRMAITTMSYFVGRIQRKFSTIF